MIKTKLHSNRHFCLMHFEVMGTKDGIFLSVFERK